MESASPAFMAGDDVARVSMVGIVAMSTGGNIAAWRAPWTTMWTSVHCCGITERV